MIVRSLVLVLLLCGPVSADVGLHLIVQTARLDDQPSRNVGASIELSIERARWQYFTELGVLGVSLGNEFGPGVRGTMYRGGIGMRHIARRFEINQLRMDLGLEAVVAIQAIDWHSGAGDLRPELDGGFSWHFGYSRIEFRTSIRIALSAAPVTDAPCLRSCPAADALTASYMLVTGLSW